MSDQLERNISLMIYLTCIICNFPALDQNMLESNINNFIFLSKLSLWVILIIKNVMKYINVV